MKRWFNLFIATSLFISNPLIAKAEGNYGALTRCKDSAVFKRRLDGSVKKLTSRLANYEEGTPSYLALEQQIERTKLRFEKYGQKGLLCGADGLPHLIANFDSDHAGEFVIPGFGFLYISGWIGWVGRSYLQFAKKADKPSESEIIINVPVALMVMSTGFLWPVAALKELTSGQLVVPNDQVTTSPR